MNVLLVNPWIHDFATYDLWIKPLGLLHLAGVLQQHGFQLDYVDCLQNRFECKPDGRGKFAKQPIPTPEPLRGVKRQYGRYGISPGLFRSRLETINTPDVIFVTSGMTYWYPGVQETISQLKAKFPKTRIVLGGIYATLMPDHAARHSGADQVISRQFENDVISFLAGSSSGQYRTLDDYPYPAWHLDPNLPYRVLLTSRGCPYRCTFCASDILNEQRFVQRSPDAVFEEIDFYWRQGVREFVFYDDALLVNHRRHLMPLLERVIRSGMDVHFHTPNGLNAREVDEDLAELMFRSGFRTIRLSLESTNPEIQKLQGNNKVNNHLFEMAVRNLHQAGYQRGDLECYLIMGLPGQTPPEVRAGLSFVEELGVVSRLATFSPIPGTPEAELARKTIGDSFLEEPLLQNHSVFPMKDISMTADELQRIKFECAAANARVRHHERVKSFAE